MDETPFAPPGPEQTGPEQMRAAMADYVRSAHEAYLQAASLLPVAIRGAMPLLGRHFTVVAAGVGNLHVIATRQALAPPEAPEVALRDELPSMTWTLRFFDPVVEPQLGLIDESRGEAGTEVRRVLGISTHLYHLMVQPGAALGAHHAGHTGTGLANAHAAAARDFESLRHVAPSQIDLIDEMEGAGTAGLVRAHALVAREIARESTPDDTDVAALAALAADSHPDPIEVRRVLLGTQRGART